MCVFTSNGIIYEEKFISFYTRPVDDPIEISLPGLLAKGPILLSDSLDTNMCLQIFQKNKIQVVFFLFILTHIIA